MCVLLPVWENIVGVWVIAREEFHRHLSDELRRETGDGGFIGAVPVVSLRIQSTSPSWNVAITGTVCYFEL